MMRILKCSPLATAWLCLAVIVPASAQELRPAPEVMTVGQGLTAVGHAELKLKPDIAVLNLGVVTQSRDQAEAVRTNATRAAAVIGALRGAGVAEKDIQTQFFGVQPQYDYTAQPPVLTGYQVTNSLQVTVRDLAKTGQVIDKITQVGANQINGVSFDLADRTKAQGDALIRAVVMAKGKATGMAQAAGVSLGRLVSLTEGTVAPVQPVFMAAMRASAGPLPSTTPVEAQQIVITADVTAVYAIGLP